MKTPPFQALKVSVPANEELLFPAPGNFLQVKEADFSFELGLDDGQLMPWDVGMGLQCDPLDSFQIIRIRNTGPTTSNFQIIYGRGTVIDDRLNIVESRNGSAASNTPPGLTEYISAADVVGLDTWALLVPYDENRVSVDLMTDAASIAYFGLTGSDILAASRNLAVTPGPLKIRTLYTKAAIYVRHHESGKKIYALTTNF